MSVRGAGDCWEWTCIWGCHGYAYSTQEQAWEAFVSHRCVTDERESGGESRR